MIPFPDKKYQIIYADPPWNLHGVNKSGMVTSRDSPNNPSYAHLNQYKSMSYANIKALPVNNLSADNCILFMWVVDNSLPFAFDIFKEWDFAYKTVGFTWVKLTKENSDAFGMGQWTRNNPEMCLIATKGKIARICSDIRQLQQHPLSKHSKNPLYSENSLQIWWEIYPE